MRASKKVKGAVLLTAGAALILGAPTVYADTNTNHNGGLLNGVQALNGLSVNLPINACGVGAVLGAGAGNCKSSAGNDNGGDSISLGHTGVGRGGGNGGDQGDVTSSHNQGLLNGVQALNNVTLNVPVNVCGVGALLATGRGKCKSSAGDGNGGDSISLGKHGRAGHGGNGGDQGDVTSRNNEGLLNGVQALNNVSANVPVDLCGVGLLLASGDGNCEASAGNGNGGDSISGTWRHDREGHEWREWRDRDGREWREDRKGEREWWDDHGREWRGGAGNGGDQGDVISRNNEGLLNGLQLLNNVDANVPITVCGLAVLGSAHCKVEVEAGNRNGGDVVRRHIEIERERHRHFENEVLPHTGATGLAILPFGLALVAGGVALRRRVASQR